MGASDFTAPEPKLGSGYSSVIIGIRRRYCFGPRVFHKTFRLEVYIFGPMDELQQLHLQALFQDVLLLSKCNLVLPVK